MARIRTVKPTFWTDDKVTSVCRDARLMFIGIWNFAGDDGLIEDKPRQIKLLIFPGDDDLSVDDIARLIGYLVEVGLMDRYVTPDGETTYLHVRHWVRHQRVDRPSKGVVDLADLQIRRGLASPREGSSASLDAEGNGREGKGEELTTFVPLSSPVGEPTGGPPNGEALGREDVEALCGHLADRIEANTGRRPKVTKSWRDACRLMLDRDNRRVDWVTRAIDWATNDEFWRTNILSMPTLRRQYDRLALAAQRDQRRAAGTPGGRSTVDGRVHEGLQLADRLAAAEAAAADVVNHPAIEGQVT
jgi:hypothetical protein